MTKQSAKEQLAQTEMINRNETDFIFELFQENSFILNLI